MICCKEEMGFVETVARGALAVWREIRITVGDAAKPSASRKDARAGSAQSLAPRFSGLLLLLSNAVGDKRDPLA